MIELPGWNALISVNGFCYSSSMGESPKLNIPLKTSTAPTKGIAPATFARNSTATYIDNDGILQTAGIDVIRFQNGRYLCEPAATNMLSYSELLTNVYWGGIRLSIAEDAPIGMFKLTNTVSGQCYLYSSPITSTNGLYYTQSAEFKKGNTNFVSMAFSDVINALRPYAIFDLNVGTVSYIKDCVANITPLDGNKFRCSVTTLSYYSGNKPFGIITPSRNGAAWITGVVGDYIYANKIQTETGTQETSYVPTTITAVTRAADVLHYDVGDVITQGQGSLYCEFIYSYTTGFPRVLELYSDSLNEIIVRVHSSKVLGAYVILGGITSTILSTSYALQDLTMYKVCVVYKNNDFRFYVNGVLIGQLSSVTIPNLYTLAVGMTRLSTSQLNGGIGNIKYLKEVLTPAEAIKLTTL